MRSGFMPLKRFASIDQTAAKRHRGCLRASFRLSFLSLLLFTLALCCSCAKQRGAINSYSVAQMEAEDGTLKNISFPGASSFEKKANEWIKSATDRELLGQVLMVFVPGTSPNANAEKILKTAHPGAVILFAPNIAETPEKVREFTDFIRKHGTVRGVAPFVSVDHEGGTVFRLKSNATRLPAALALGERSGTRVSAAVLAGGIAGKELAGLGFTLNLAPVAESAAASQVLTTRIWSEIPEAAGKFAGAYLGAHQSAGTACALKHFPGTGSEDPHEKLSSLPADPELFYSRFIRPFVLAGKEGPAAMLLSLVVAPALDNTPSVFSEKTVTAYIKQKLGYAGFILTDDLYMKALSGFGTIPERCLKALNAGCDMLMLSGGTYEEIGRAHV